MLCINLTSDDPCFNLAVEEFLLKNSKEEYLLLYVNAPSVIIGKHQSAHRESNTMFVAENKIPVIRRISGGGTVFHDHGNLNFTFIIQSSAGRQVDFRKYTLPVIGFLDSLGVNAVFEGKNDLRINGLKISGNAEHVYHNRVLHHGTLLFDTDLTFLKKTLRNDTSHYTTRAVASNPSPVMNLKELLVNIPGTDKFREIMLNYFLSAPGYILHDLSDETGKMADCLAESKFRTWDWNYAYGPEYDFNNRFEFEGQPADCRIMVKNGIIQECEIEGKDYLNAAAKRLIGSRHMPDDIDRILAGMGIKNNFTEWMF